MTITRQIVLKSRPMGRPDETNFEFVQTSLPALNQNEVLVKTRYLSLDPYLRNMMNEEEFVGPSFQLGQVFGGLAVGEVIESTSLLFQSGDFVSGAWGWQTFANVDAEPLTKINPDLSPVSTALGVLGISGLTAYFGLTEIGKPKVGETVVISGAAGAVGMLAGQIAKLFGAKVIGIAGSAEKNAYLQNELGFDATINYRMSNAELLAELKKAAPDGVDVYFDNVGGTITDAVLQLINPGARIPISGQIAQYNQTGTEMGPRIGMLLVKNSALMQGFSFTNYSSQFPEALEKLSGWIKEGRLKYKEHIIDGFEHTPKAFSGLFSGENTGKLLVKIPD
ncbi:NADP-dependent oxidoreductase [Paenibacillus arenilitoris]|uniref:NADP-dependent oxidoreductase n=1 Tax=Paenibacillus arenilitoris TaxID=2772299 RepID=A0A927H602_9BACL|nr:NADP-dependent oxidoreductase [Paenibacillus arenilitoris]MBD2870016.1 NADP-dependent oxidoreductase [Paenibacillus arenilitoris]